MVGVREAATLLCLITVQKGKRHQISVRYMWRSHAGLPFWSVAV